MLYKAVTKLLGVDAFKRPALIDHRNFSVMQQLRLKQGIVQNFPGWLSILAEGQSLGGPCSLIDELIRFDETRILLVGGPSQIFTYHAGTKTLTDISTPFTFTANRDNPWWSFFYNDFLYIVNKRDGLFKTDGSSMTRLGAAPKARIGGVLNDHLLLFNILDDTNDRPQRFQWAAEGSDTDWFATPNNDAGSFEITDEGDVGVGMLPLGNDIILYKDRTIIPVTFIGGNEVFGRRTTLNGIGLIGSYAVVDIGDEHLLMGNDQFYGYRGGQDLDPEIGLAVRDLVYPQLHPLLKGRSRSLFIEESHEALFMYPTVDATEDPNRCIVYNIEEKQWYGPFPIECSMTGFTSRAFTVVVDDIQDIVDTVPTIVDEFPGSIGQPVNLFADGSGDLFQIGASQDANGEEVIRILETGDHFLGLDSTDSNGAPANVPLGTVFQVGRVEVEVGDLIFGGTFELSVGHRMELDDPIIFGNPITVDLSKHTLRIPVRATGRWFRLRFLVRESQQFSLVGYQYCFNIVGRR